jgi:outer membrane protein assembly factor BamD (BamD/ComL family)
MRRMLIILSGVCTLVGGCNRTSPEEQMMQAQQAMDMQNFTMAIEIYSRVITDHSSSPQADTSAFMIATIYNNNLRDYEKAVGAYRDYLKRYPEGRQAPMALFLIGYLYNNELRNLDSAAAAYRSFLAVYPDHDMAPSAKFELDNLGKTPEQLIPQDVTAATKEDAGTAKGRQ